LEGLSEFRGGRIEPPTPPPFGMPLLSISAPSILSTFFLTQITTNFQHVFGVLIIKYIITFEVQFVGYLNITDLINARKMKRIKIISNLVGWACGAYG